MFKLAISPSARIFINGFRTTIWTGILSPRASSSRAALIETITHLALNAGWPNAVTALGVAKEVFER